ncbi:transposable element Tcb2 transposase [Trichonephila clavipes]|nr:transposable element Tcb2 transposase [Trichonephila clavipes]
MQRLPGAIFQQYNARPLTSRVSQDCLCTVTTLPLPARSSDRSPIENIWDHLGRRVGHPTSLNELEARFVEWAQNEIAVVPEFHKRILFSDEAHFWLNGYVEKQNCCISSEANPQVYVETPLHPENLTDWCALWAGGILLQKR